MKSIKKYSIFMLLFINLSCSSIQQTTNYGTYFRENILVGQCEKAQYQIPLEKDDTKFIKFYQQSIGYAATVSVLPITVSLDILFTMRCKYGCADEVNSKPFLEILFPTTTYMYEATKDMRCPDTSYYVQKIVEVAECYEKRADKVSLQTALDQVAFLNQQYENGLTCIKVIDSHLINSSKLRIENKLNLLDKK